MTESKPSLYIIAAACESLGIGFRGDLPWKLRKEMAYFKRMTTKTKDSEKQNAVIIGRKTWFSIPPKHRPLPERFNVVISRDLKETPEGAHCLAQSLQAALKLLTSPPLEEKIEKIWVIGGSSIYKMAMESPYCHRIYLTRILAKFDCDTFFPQITNERFYLTTDPDVPSDIQEENGIQYRFEIYEKK